MKRILVFGQRGQVASSLRLVLSNAHFMGRTQCDFTKKGQIESALNNFAPDIVINTAAYTDVDLAEEERAKAFAINAFGPKLIAEWCRSANASLIHYSSDYVFSGKGTRPWCEKDSPQPLNTYGTTKLAGERAIAQSGCHFYILRTSWVYSGVGRNFFNTMFDLGKKQDEMSVVNDQLGAPTFALDLARATVQLMQHPGFLRSSRILHMTNSGVTSWHGFAEAIFSELRAAGQEIRVQKIKPISTSEYPAAAQRPLNSRLDDSLLREKFSIKLRDWKEALKENIHTVLS